MSDMKPGIYELLLPKRYARNLAQLRVVSTKRFDRCMQLKRPTESQCT